MIREVTKLWTGDSPCGACTDFNTSDLQHALLKLDTTKFPSTYAGPSEIRATYLETVTADNPYRGYVFSYEDDLIEGQVLTDCHIIDIECLECCDLQAACPQKIPDTEFLDPANPTEDEVLDWLNNTNLSVSDRWYAGGTSQVPTYLAEVKSCGPILYVKPAPPIVFPPDEGYVNFTTADSFDPANPAPPSDYIPSIDGTDEEDGDNLATEYGNGYVVVWDWAGGTPTNPIVIETPEGISPITTSTDAATGVITYTYTDESGVPTSWSTPSATTETRTSDFIGSDTDTFDRATAPQTIDHFGYNASTYGTGVAPGQDTRIGVKLQNAGLNSDYITTAEQPRGSVSRVNPLSGSDVRNYNINGDGFTASRLDFFRPFGTVAASISGQDSGDTIVTEGIINEDLETPSFRSLNFDTVRTPVINGSIRLSPTGQGHVVGRSRIGGVVHAYRGNDISIDVGDVENTSAEFAIQVGNNAGNAFPRGNVKAQIRTGDVDTTNGIRIYSQSVTESAHIVIDGDLKFSGLTGMNLLNNGGGLTDNIYIHVKGNIIQTADDTVDFGASIINNLPNVTLIVDGYIDINSAIFCQSGEMHLICKQFIRAGGVLETNSNNFFGAVCSNNGAKLSVTCPTIISRAASSQGTAFIHSSPVLSVSNNSEIILTDHTVLIQEYTGAANQAGSTLTGILQTSSAGGGKFTFHDGFTAYMADHDPSVAGATPGQSNLFENSAGVSEKWLIGTDYYTNVPAGSITRNSTGGSQIIQTGVITPGQAWVNTDMPTTEY